jgi:hypothetical protein
MFKPRQIYGDGTAPCLLAIQLQERSHGRAFGCPINKPSCSSQKPSSVEIIMKSFIIVASCSVLLLLAGCGTNPTKAYEPAAPATSERTAQGSGVEVAIDPFVESSRTKEYFHMDAVDNGIAILHVRVANKNAQQSFLVEKKNFQLIRNGSAGDLTGDGKKIERSNTAGDAVAWTGAVAVSAPLLMISGGMVSHATEIQRNFTSKELGDASLSPGESIEGFIYFKPVNHGEDWTRNASVKINLTEMKSQQTIALNIPLSH